MTAHITSDSTAIGVLTSGVIDVVFCDVESIVKAGQVCAQIDARPYRFIVERGNVDLSLANGRLEKSRAHVARARAKYERNQGLFKRKAIALSALKVSQKALEQMRAEVADAEAAADLAQAALAAAQSNLQHTSIFSPIAGTVVARSVAVGQAVVAARTEPLFRVAADPSIVQINVTVDARVANAPRVGDVVSLSLEPERDHPFVGKVTQISLNPKPSKPTANYDIVITAANPDLRLKPGMSTTIRIMPSGALLPASGDANHRPISQ
ncbi:MAG: efflux RND transporter periplasmic adaptor subunit [Methylocystis silviterrae]